MEIVFDKKCPSCGCNKMIKRDSPRMIMTPLYENDAIVIGNFMQAVTTRYICYDCGYLARFYEGEELEKIKRVVDNR